MASSADLQKPTDLDLHCLQRQGISGFSRTRVNSLMSSGLFYHLLFGLVCFQKEGDWLVLIVTLFNRNSYIEYKQCRPWSDATFFSVSGSTLFAN